MDRPDDTFDFDTFDNNDQDVGLVADNHLFNNGPDLYSPGPCDILAGSVAMVHYDNVIMPFASSLSQAATTPPPYGPHYFDHTLEPFQGIDFDTGATGIPSLPRQLASQPVTPQYQDDDFGLVFHPGLPAVPFMPTPAVVPAAVFDGTVMFPQTVPGAPLAPPTTPAMGFDQQQWQKFTNQQAQIYLTQPRDLHVRLQQWQVAKDRFDLGLRSPFQSPVEEQPLQNIQFSPKSDSSKNYQPAQASQHTQISTHAQDSTQQQAILSDKQIQLLQNADSAEYAQPGAQEHSHQAAHIATSLPTTPSSSEDKPLQSTTRIRKAAPNRTAHIVRRAPAPYSGSQDHSSPRTSIPGLTFVSLRDAEAAMSSRYIESSWRAPLPDNTIPSSQHDRSEYVLMMFNAFQDTSECKDNKDGFSFLKRWTRPGYYNLQQMEKVCWHMLDVAERLHAQGPTASSIYCEDALKKLKASRGLTFEQRIHAICAMLKFSKNLCDNLLKGEGIEALVGAPKQKMSGAKTMMVQNQKRQKWIMHGRSEDPLHANVGGNEGLRPEGEDITKYQAKEMSKRSRPPAKSRTMTGARSLQVSGENSNAESEPAQLLRRTSVVTLRRPSAFSTTDVDETHVDHAEHETAAKLKAKRRFRKRAIDLTAADSKEKQPNPPKPRQRRQLPRRYWPAKTFITRKTMLPSSKQDQSADKSFALSDLWEQNPEEGSKSDQEAIYNGSVKYSNRNEDHSDSVFEEEGENNEEDEDADSNISNEEEESEPNQPPSPHPPRKCRISNFSHRESFASTHSPIRTATRSTKPATTAHRHRKHWAQNSSTPQTSIASRVLNKRKVGGLGSEEDYEPTGRVKRTRRDKHETAQVSAPATPVLSQRVVKVKYGKPLRDAQGRFIRR